MLSKELEILKHITELYKSDVTDDEFIQQMQGKETLIQAWADAFEGYLLRDVLDAIDEYFTKKNNRTPPRIAQIKAMLNANNIHGEQEVTFEKKEDVRPCLGYQYMEQDDEEGNMRWFVPDYLEVEKLIRQDKWGFVQNIYKPTLEEFHRCLELYCEELTGEKFRFFSDNDFAKLSEEQKRIMYKEALEFIERFKPRNLDA